MRDTPSSPQQKKPSEEETKTATLSDVVSSRRAILKGVEAKAVTSCELERFEELSDYVDEE